MDNFTSDSPVTVKQPDYYEMVKEAAKAELSMLLSKEMLIINKYYWKCEEKAERGVQ